MLVRCGERTAIANCGSRKPRQGAAQKNGRGVLRVQVRRQLRTSTTERDGFVESESISACVGEWQHRSSRGEIPTNLPNRKFESSPSGSIFRCLEWMADAEVLFGFFLSKGLLLFGQSEGLLLKFVQRRTPDRLLRAAASRCGANIRNKKHD